jgi:PAS domain S-box-containing protein
MIHAEDGEVLTVNRTWKELTGYDEDLLTIDAWVDRTNPEDPVGVRDEIASLFEATARVVEGVFPVACRDGSKRLWEFSSSPLGTLPDGRRLVISMAADLTERMEASAARELLMTAIEQLGEAVIITDADGAIEYVNRAFERTTGYSRGEAAGRNPRMLRSGEHDDAFYAELWGTLAQGRTWKGRMRNRRKDGTLFTEETTISPVRDDGGAIRHYVAVKNDITARLELEDRLRQRSKMESIGRLAGGVAHDFNNMLTVILGHTELALDSVAPAAPIHDNLVEIRQAAERSGEMTRQLLAFARHQASQPARVSPNDRIEGMVRLLRRLIGEGIELVWKPQPALGQVEVDPGQFDQVLTNLCVNARDAIDGTGTVTIETRKVALDDLHCRSRAGLEPGEYFLLTVSDDGRGMDSTTLERAFEPYFTTKGIGKGTGLGLATVYGIAEQNRGFVEADSAPGSGATFRLYLPLVAAPELPVLPEEPRSAEAAAGGTILLVEDEPLILELGTEMLHRLGYTVLPAGGPDDALRLAADHRGTIDLLITDVVMPSMTGPELAERLQTLRPEMPCLYISGFTADAMAARGGMEDDIHFLQKPFLLQDLAAKVRTAVGSPPGRVVPA